MQFNFSGVVVFIEALGNSCSCLKASSKMVFMDKHRP